MYKHILIATDGSELAGKAVAAGFSLARLLEAKVTVVTVTEPWTALVSGDIGIAFPVDEYEKSSSENAAHILASVSKLARKADIECATVHAKDQYPAEGILETARTNNCDLIVMASHGRRGLGRLLLGSQAVKVLTHSTVPALITGSVGRTAMYKHLLIATDGSSASAKAISDRIVLAKAVVTQTTVVMVTKPWGEAA